MNDTWFIADLHIGHRGIIQFEKTRPFRMFDDIEEHDEEIIKRWNSVVRAGDSVWVLGDAVFGKKNLLKLGRLNGTKRLVMGNHDMYPAMEYLKYFTRLCGAVEWKGCLLTHVPVHSDQVGAGGRYRANIHGHLPTDRVHKEESIVTGVGTLIEMIPNPCYICVSAEQVNLTPISAEEILKRVGNGIR